MSQNRRRVGELSCAAISGKGYARKSVLIGCVVSTLCLVLLCVCVSLSVCVRVHVPSCISMCNNYWSHDNINHLVELRMECKDF